MEAISVNYLAIVAGAVFSMILGFVWYGPIFGKKWMEIVGVDPKDLEARKQMQKSAGPLYGVQFLYYLQQLYIVIYTYLLYQKLIFIKKI